MPETTEQLSKLMAAKIAPLVNQYNLRNRLYRSDKEAFEANWKRFIEEQKPPKFLSFRMLERLCKQNPDVNRKKYLEVAKWLSIPVKEELVILDVEVRNPE